MGKTWLALGLGPLGIPFGPTFAGRTGNHAVYFGESIRKKVRVEEITALKRWWGQDQPLERVFQREVKGKH